MKASPTTTRPTSPHRRRLVAGLGIGLCAVAAGWLRRPRPENGTGAPPASPHRAPSDNALETSANADSVRSAPDAPMFSRERFLPHLRSEFQVETARQSPTSLRLTDISPAALIKNGDTIYSTFSLSFEGPADHPVESSIQRLKHAILGEMDLFLSPVGHLSDPARYEAVFTLRI